MRRAEVDVGIGIGAMGKANRGTIVRPVISKLVTSAVGALLTTGVPPEAAGGVIYLSDFLGGASGSAVTTSNAPFMTLRTVSNSGIGIDTLGSFSGGIPITFDDAGTFDKGIGAHPDSVIDFHLDAFRNGNPFAQFEAVIGISSDFGGDNGARFIVELDGGEVFRQDIEFTTTGSTSIAIPIPGDAATLTLETQFVGGGGNHAAWADARLVVPEPGTLAILLGGLTIVFLPRRQFRRA